MVDGGGPMLSLGRLMGMRVLLDHQLTQWVEDWSQVRSPSRALRRRQQGHRQRTQMVRHDMAPMQISADTVVVGPDTWAQLQLVTVPRSDPRPSVRVL